MSGCFSEKRRLGERKSVKEVRARRRANQPRTDPMAKSRKYDLVGKRKRPCQFKSHDRSTPRASKAPYQR